MIKTVKQEVFSHEYTRVIITMDQWKYLYDWALENMARDPEIPEPHGSWWAVPAPSGADFYFYSEEDAAMFLLSAPINQHATA